MAWQIHYLKSEHPRQTSATVLHDALALARQFMQDGHIVEKVQADSGMTIWSHQVLPLWDTFC
jgi:hypothetical protein